MKKLNSSVRLNGNFEIRNAKFLEKLVQSLNKSSNKNLFANLPSSSQNLDRGEFSNCFSSSRMRARASTKRFPIFFQLKFEQKNLELIQGFAKMNIS